MTPPEDEHPERPRHRALVAETIGRALAEDDIGANAILHSLDLEELRFFAGAAVEMATALAVETFGGKDAAARYAEVVMLNATIESTPKEA